MKKFKNKLFIIAAIASLFGLYSNIQTHAMTNNSIEEKNDFLCKNNSIEEKNNFLCKKRNKDNTEDSKNDNYFYNKFPFNYDNLNNSFDEEKSYEFKLDEFKPDEFTEDSKNNIYFYNKFPVNNNLNSNSANNKQNENVSNNKNIIPSDEYNSLKKDLGETIKNCKEFFIVFENGKLSYNYSTIYTYIKKMRNKVLHTIKTKYPNITNKIFNEIFDEILIEAIREKHKDDENYIFNFKIQNDNGSYVGVTQNDKDKIQNVISHLTKDIKTLNQSSISHCKNAVKYLLMANTKIQKSDNKTDYLDKNTANKFADILLNRIKNVNNKSNNSANNEQNENVSNNENIIIPDEYNSLKKYIDGIIEKYKAYFQVYKEGEQKGELIYSYSSIYKYIKEIRNKVLLRTIKTKYPNITTQIFDEIFIEAIRKEHKDNKNHIFNFTIQNDNGSYVGVTQNDKNKIQTIISTLTKAIKALSQISISNYRNGVKYLLMAYAKIQKSDNKTDYLDKDTAEKFAKQLIEKS